MPQLEPCPRSLYRNGQGEVPEKYAALLTTLVRYVSASPIGDGLSLRRAIWRGRH